MSPGQVTLLKAFLDVIHSIVLGFGQGNIEIPNFFFSEEAVFFFCAIFVKFIPSRVFEVLGWRKKRTPWLLHDKSAERIWVKSDWIYTLSYPPWNPIIILKNHYFNGIRKGPRVFWLFDPWLICQISDGALALPQVAKVSRSLEHLRIKISLGYEGNLFFQATFILDECGVGRHQQILFGFCRGTMVQA